MSNQKLSQKNKSKMKLHEMKGNHYFHASGHRLLVVLGLLLSFPALAEDSSSILLEEVIVTAQKRTENLQDVPMSITALSESKLDRLNILDMSDYVKVVPSLSYIDRGPTGRRGNRPLALRGVYAGAGEATVGFYVNEVPIPAFDPALYDISRIEVLRGPQGTLYGASSMGGTIKIVTNQPNNTEFSSRVDTTGSYTHDGGFNILGSAMVNVPLVADQLALRVTAVSRNYDGYIDNINTEQGDGSSTVVDLSPFAIDKNHNTENVNSLRAALSYMPNDNFSITPSILFQKTDVGARDTYLSSLDGLQSSFKLDTGTTEENFLADVTINWSVGSSEFVSSTSWYATEFDDPDDLTDLERSFVPSIPPIAQENIGETTVFTQEVRWLSTDQTPYSDRVSWTAGAFYTNKDDERNGLESAPGFGAATRDDILFLSGEFGLSPDEISEIFFGVPFDSITDVAFAYNAKREVEEFAVFGEATGHLTDQLDLLVGLRWFKSSYSRLETADGLFNGGPSGPSSGSDSDSDINPKVSLSYRTKSDQLIYSTVAKGYRAGGSNIPVGAICEPDLADLGLTNTPAGYDSDSIWSYEIGTKLNFENLNAVLNAAVYYIDWSDIQQAVFLPGCFQGFTANVGAAHSQGFEVEFQMRPYEALILGAGLSYTDAVFDESDENAGIEKGDPVQIVPQWKFNVDMEYTFSLGEERDGFIGANYQYTSEANFGFDFDNPQVNERPAYDVAGMQAGVRWADWELSLFVDNLFNERPKLGVLAFGTRLGTDDLFINTLRPRTAGVTLRAWFQ